MDDLCYVVFCVMMCFALCCVLGYVVFWVMLCLCFVVFGLCCVCVLLCLGDVVFVVGHVERVV